jgi:hypothetical protein
MDRLKSSVEQIRVRPRGEPYYGDSNSINRASQPNYKISNRVQGKDQYNGKPNSKEYITKLSKQLNNVQNAAQKKYISLKNSNGELANNNSNSNLRITSKASGRINFSSRGQSDGQQMRKSQEMPSRNEPFCPEEFEQLRSSIVNNNLTNPSTQNHSSEKIHKQIKTSNSNLKYSLRNHFLPESLKGANVKGHQSPHEAKKNLTQSQVRKSGNSKVEEIIGNNYLSFSKMKAKKNNNSGVLIRNNNGQTMAPQQDDQNQRVVLQRSPEFDNFIQDQNYQSVPNTLR